MKIKALLYITKQPPYLIQGTAKPMHTLDVNNPFNFNWKLVKKVFSNDRLNGKIVIECDYEVEEIEYIAQVNFRCFGVDEWFVLKNHKETNLYKHSCLGFGQMLDYFKDKLDYDTVGYAIHINNLNIFDEPRKLSDCITIKRGMEYFCSGMFNPSEEGDIFNYLKSAPNKIRKVWFEKYGMIKPYFIIPVSPEEMCRIANNEQTALIRKNVLKEMLKND